MKKSELGNAKHLLSAQKLTLRRTLEILDLVGRKARGKSKRLLRFVFNTLTFFFAKTLLYLLES